VRCLSSRSPEAEVLAHVADRRQQDRAPRQRTLRGALDWSYDLLADRERLLFRRLSVFAGGWTLGATEAVGTGGGVEDVDVTDLLSGLVDKSLVVAEAGSTAGGLRYRMLEPVRQYARERLEEGDEEDAVRRRHAMFFLALAEEAEPAVEWGQQQERLERLETEHDNFRLALQWLLEQGEDTELGLRMGAGGVLVHAGTFRGRARVARGGAGEVWSGTESCACEGAM